MVKTELQYLHFKNREQQGLIRLGRETKEWAAHSELLGVLQDINSWHHGHDFKRDEDLFDYMVKRFGPFAGKEVLEGNRKAHRWAIEINGTQYDMFLTDLGMFLEAHLGTNVVKANEDMKELLTRLIPRK